MNMANLNFALQNLFGPLDPAPEFRFYVIANQLLEGAFAECSGMSARREIVTVNEGGVNHYSHKLPGRVSYGEITLRKGVMFSIEFWYWFTKGMEDGMVKRDDLTILHHSSYFNLPARWYHIKKAYPVSWEGPSLRTDSNQIAIESITLTFETLEVEEWDLFRLMGELGT